ncbi:dehydrodolichyl diphosphate synthase 6 [Mangifera indica]|uniref:dehydrodolichyl diphosphate synthase 6 n=1 Tax=Mangifera indica TaxID=29780 RepID=UPI001CFA76FD|nr:dehydrodolichyl diphosphate synthase 6 [Mangifera indica]
METQTGADRNQLFKRFSIFLRKCMFKVLSVGAIPDHIAFILDGNRRYAKKHNLIELGEGYQAGFLALLSMLKYCSELGVKYVTIFAFSIDNYKRKPSEVQYIMDLMLEKIEMLLLEESIVHQYNIRVHFIGNMGLLNEAIRVAAEKVMRATAKNTRTIILVCLAYTSSNEITHAVEESCLDKSTGQAEALKLSTEEHENIQEMAVIKLADVEKHMYMDVAPDPDILIRTARENRLSNFLLWQSSNSLLYSPAALWPEISLWHLVWAVLNFQRCHSYLQKKKKQP